MASSYAHCIREEAQTIKKLRATEELRKIIAAGGDTSAQYEALQRSMISASRSDSLAGELLQDVLRDIKELQDTGDLPGVASGIPELDEMTDGFAPGDLVIIAARPSMGKTTLASNIGTHAANDKEGDQATIELQKGFASLNVETVDVRPKVILPKCKDILESYQKDRGLIP
jgi:replicative DNA helicase